MMASTQAKDETYYDVLKVERKATIAEIVAAYHAAKNAFSRDSVATYSLFSSDEAKSILDRLEEAYLTLSNLDKKREYDRWLAEKSNSMMMPSMTELERHKAANLSPSKEKEPTTLSPQSPGTGGGAGATAAPAADAAPITFSADQPLTGATMREIREKRGLSLDDVSRITKIPAKFIRAIEGDDAKGLPARVYLQGFVKNLASVYKLEAQSTLQAYLSHVDKLIEPTPG